MYTQHLREWNVAKNITSQDVLEYLQGLKHPADLTFPDGSSSIMIRGRMIAKQKLLKHIRRCNALHKTEPKEADFVEENAPRTSKASSEDKDEYHTTHSKITDEVPYQDCESTPVTDELSINLTSEELNSLSIAMLQTDFHYQQNDEDTSLDIEGTTKKQFRHPLLAHSPSQLLAGPPELCDLAFILNHSNVAYAQFPDTKCLSSAEPFRLAARQQRQAKDMYARHWLAVELFPKGVHKETSRLLVQNWAQMPLMLEDHPHFLPWIAFVVCYTGSSGCQTMSNMGFRRCILLSTEILPENDPRRQILERLMASKFRRSICLVLLRQVISIFRRELQSSHMQSMELLARLFDTIEKCESFDGNVVEETLRRWAEGSLAIADVIREEKRTARMKAERDAFDPVQ